MERRFYWFITVIAAIGVVAALAGIAQQVSIVDAVAGRQVNKLVHALPGQTSWATLRYATAIAAPIGIYLWRRKLAPGNLALFNVALLVVNIALASRISLIVAILVYAMLQYRALGKVRIKIWALVAGAAVIFMSLTAFTYVRSANYYEENGVSSPIAMNFYQIASYLGAPAQVSVGVSNLIADGSFRVTGDPVSSLGAITPTFLADKDLNQPSSVSERYNNRVSIADNLSTNSAFADTYAAFGGWGLFYTLVPLGIGAFGFGVFARYRSVVVSFSAVLLYGFFEYWRIFMFNKGFLLFLLFAIGAAVVFSFALPRLANRFRKLRYRRTVLER
ncbi:hypothetical protein [Leifsonia sp. A12D58]|uniref:hypothetical protein n=1 Tax=Leifsonia sp. A12D58 TaxID=3397674 RepID=UPI0039E14BC3